MLFDFSRFSLSLVNLLLSLHGINVTGFLRLTRIMRIAGMINSSGVMATVIERLARVISPLVDV